MRYLIIILCLTNALALAQTNTLNSFIAKGFTILDSASGDLNKDGFRDVVLILKNSFEENNADTTRPLLILHGNNSKTYTLAAKNEHAVLCQGCGGVLGDPYENVVIKNNYFSVEHYGGSNWRWTRIITFKYDLKTKQYVLHRDAGISYHTSDPDKTINTIANKKDFGKLPFVQYNFN